MAGSAILNHGHLDPARLDVEVDEHGLKALWRRVRTCPCIDPRTLQADIGCPICLDEGLLWDAGQGLKVLMTGRSKRDQYGDVGSWINGFAPITFPSLIVPGHYDRVELIESLMIVRQILKRGDTDRLARSRERLRFRTAVVAVEYLEAIDPGDPSATQQFAAGTDFNVDVDGSILWEAGQGPAEGTQYSVRYSARPTYIVWVPQEREEGGQKLNYKVQAQRFDFFSPAVVGGN